MTQREQKFVRKWCKIRRVGMLWYSTTTIAILLIASYIGGTIGATLASKSGKVVFINLQPLMDFSTSFGTIIFLVWFCPVVFAILVFLVIAIKSWKRNEEKYKRLIP